MNSLWVREWSHSSLSMMAVGNNFTCVTLSNELSECKSLSHVQLFVTPWAIESMEFTRPEYWSGQPFLSPGGLPNPGIELRSPALKADSLPAEPPGKPKNTGVGSLSFLQHLFQASPQTYEVGSVVPILQMSSPRHRKLETLPKFAQLVRAETRVGNQAAWFLKIVGILFSCCQCFQETRNGKTFCLSIICLKCDTQAQGSLHFVKNRSPTGHISLFLNAHSQLRWQSDQPTLAGKQ